MQPSRQTSILSYIGHREPRRRIASRPVSANTCHFLRGDAESEIESAFPAPFELVDISAYNAHFKDC
jgi:hypothetical protein